MKRKHKTPLQKFEKLWTWRCKKHTSKYRRCRIDTKIGKLMMDNSNVKEAWAKRFAATFRDDGERSV